MAPRHSICRPTIASPTEAIVTAALISGFAGEGDKITVPTVRSDTYCAQAHVDQADLVKIDVEGAEIRVLYGMGGLLDAWRPDLLLEVLPGYADQLTTFFRTRFYDAFLVTDDGLVPAD
jgi:hypothetical protein